MLVKKNENWREKRPLSDFIRATAKYRKWRKDIIERDNYVCQSCNKRKKLTQVHHKINFNKLIKENNITTIEEAINCKDLWDMDNGITMCRKCHNIYHKINFFKIVYVSIRVSFFHITTVVVCAPI